MADLVKTDETGSAWYPVSISLLEQLLSKVIVRGYGYRYVYPLRKNIAYNLQYLEFLHKCLNDIKLSSVLTTQTWKSIILTGCGIMESFLHYLLVKRDLHATTEWELKIVLPGNQKKVDGVQTKADSHVYTKLSSQEATQMNFDSIIKRARSNKILGSNKDIYTNLDKLRKLRNKIHLQSIDFYTDTDWNSFNKQEVYDMDEILYMTFTSTIFRPSADQRLFFQYLHDCYNLNPLT